jgi:hypothetical protein
MTRREINEHISNLSLFYKQKNQNSFVFLESIKENIFNQYDIIYQSILENYISQINNYEDKVKSWENKMCQGCKSKLRYIEDYNFWGCPNYLDKSINHSTFNKNHLFHFDKSNIKHRVNTHWATDIKKALNIPKNITATNILDFLEFYGYEDLRTRFDYKPTKESIAGFINGNKESKKEEKEIFDFLSNLKFDKIHKQYYIKYKLIGDKEKIAILDLLISNEDKVYIIEIKRSFFDIKEEQLKLYHNLINFILNEKNDKRKLISLFCISNKSEYDSIYFKCESKYFYFDDYKNVENKNEFLSNKIFN